MIQVRRLVKAFGPQVALRGVDLDVGPGEFVTLLGPNGAGKTTLLRVLATLSPPTAGSVRVDGHDVTHAGTEIRRCIGFISHESLLYPQLSVQDNLRFYGRLYNVPDLAARVDEVLTQVGLAQHCAERVQTLSRGMIQRLAIARAILHRPRVMLLDEPYTGLDQRAAIALSAILHDLATGGRAVLLTTHNLERGLADGQRVIVLHRGQVVHQARRDEIDGKSFTTLYQTLTGM